MASKSALSRPRGTSQLHNQRQNIEQIILIDYVIS